ncbi:MAG: hypothetical protein M1820_006386 [Bogoriella megaspora]|nr:MAG: hypothetical protein M1820_006386 [Bogoriella megaspora]
MRPSILLPPPPTFLNSPDVRYHNTKVHVSNSTALPPPLRSPDESELSPILPETFRAVSNEKSHQDPRNLMANLPALLRPVSDVDFGLEYHDEPTWNTSPILPNVDGSTELQNKRGRQEYRIPSPGALASHQHTNGNRDSEVRVDVPLSSKFTDNAIAEEYHSLLDNQFFEEMGIRVDESLEDNLGKDPTLVPPPLFEDGNRSYRSLTKQRRNEHLSRVSIALSKGSFRGHRRAGSLTNSGPLSAIMGGYRRRSTSGTIPISGAMLLEPASMFDVESRNGPGLTTPISAEGACRRSSVPQDFAFSPPHSISPTPFQGSLPQSKLPNHPKSLLIIHPEQDGLRSPGLGSPEASNTRQPSPLGHQKSPTLFQSNPETRPPRAFLPMTNDELWLAAKGAAKWGDSLSATKHKDRPLKSLSDRESPFSIKESTTTSPMSPTSPTAGSKLKSVLSALGKSKSKSAANPHHVHSASTPQSQQEKSSDWTPKPMQRYPTLNSIDQSLTSPRALVAPSSPLATTRDISPASKPVHDTGRRPERPAREPMASARKGKPMTVFTNESLAAGASKLISNGARKERSRSGKRDKETWDAKRKEELKKRIKIVGPEPPSVKVEGGWI